MSRYILYPQQHWYNLQAIAPWAIDGIHCIHNTTSTKVLSHRVIILLERAYLHNRIGRNWCKFSRPEYENETARSLANGPIVAGGWGGIPRELQRLLSLIGYGSTGGVCGRSLTERNILFTGTQTCSLYLVLWLCMLSVPLVVWVDVVLVLCLSRSLSLSRLGPHTPPLFSLHLLFTTTRNYNAQQSVKVTLHSSWLLDEHWCCHVAGNMTTSVFIHIFTFYE